ncbi:uncharacterized protein [Anabrus simplex]|uniref:uncharacterized protein n=1 Tax=Anabrus simplex TaxID=316456 RepID=UPI0035A2F555
MGRVLLAVFLFGVGMSYAYTYMEIVTESPDYPGMCFDRDTKEFYASGSRWFKSGACEMLLCSFPVISGYGCGTVTVEPPCEIVPGNLSLPYPDCCPQGYCPPNAINFRNA